MFQVTIEVADWHYCGGKEQIFASKAVLILILMRFFTEKVVIVLGESQAFTDTPTPEKGTPLGSYLKL